MTPAAVGDDLLGKGKPRGKMFRNAAIILGVLTVIGIIGFGIRVADVIDTGLQNTPVWGYHAALIAFILTAAQGHCGSMVTFECQPICRRSQRPSASWR